MGLGGAVVGGVVGGVIGAVVWALVAYFAHVEIGWLAWGIGGLVGFGVFVGGGRKSGAAGGVLAVVLSVASIAAGKFAVVHALTDNAVADAVKEMESDLAKNHNNDDAFIVGIADEVAEDWEQDGKQISWPNAKTYEDRESPADYPPDMWKEAQGRWQKLSEAEREDFKKQFEEETRAAFMEYAKPTAEAMRSQGFAASWGAFDILFVVLAVITAWRIGSATSTS